MADFFLPVGEKEMALVEMVKKIGNDARIALPNYSG